MHLPAEEQALHVRRPVSKRIGEILVEMGALSPTSLTDALHEEEGSPYRFGEQLLAQGLISSVDLARAMGIRLGVPFIDFSQQRVDPSAVARISEREARRYAALPVAHIDDHTLLVAMVDPSDLLTRDDLRMLTACEIVPGIGTEEDIFEQIAKMTSLDDRVAANIDDELGLSELTADDVRDIREQVDEAPIVKLVNSVLAQAADEGASDVHFEPQSTELMIRFRRDGVLYEVMSIPRRMQSGVLSRLKIMADLDIAERRVPQDGRIGLMVGGKPIDMRVATLPTVYGEKIVIRLLDRSNVMLRLEDLGFSEKALLRYEKSFKKPYGAILVTGPTGSGKSTTLYATLNILNVPEKNIITVEDPVEYRLTGINQVQTNIKAGLTFSAGLRSILRCDPDIVMIGEIRDKETALIAVESALTGHLVLSTLHTNDAPGALSRLTEMGIEPFLTASAVDCVLAQRLARRLCDSCKEPYQPTQEMLRRNDFPLEAVESWDEIELFKPVGCPRCGGTGYKGRLGIYEVMVVTEAIERLTVERKSADEISRVAQAEGMRSLREDGIDKVLKGRTSIEEIARVIV